MTTLAFLAFDVSNTLTAVISRSGRRSVPWLTTAFVEGLASYAANTLDDGFRKGIVAPHEAAEAHMSYALALALRDDGDNKNMWQHVEAALELEDAIRQYSAEQDRQAFLVVVAIFRNAAEISARFHDLSPERVRTTEQFVRRAHDAVCEAERLDLVVNEDE